MPASGYKLVGAALSSRRDNARGPGNDEPAGRRIHAAPFLRCPEDEKASPGEGTQVGNGHVRTLLRKIGLFAMFAKPNLSKPHPGHIYTRTCLRT